MSANLISPIYCHNGIADLGKIYYGKRLQISLCALKFAETDSNNIMIISQFSSSI
jgi:hypothetical protein